MRKIEIAGWPDVLLAALYTLRFHIETIITRWDVPEIFEDRPIGNSGEGLVGRREEDDTFGRPSFPHTLAPDEIDKLTWVEQTLLRCTSQALCKRP